MDSDNISQSDTIVNWNLILLVESKVCLGYFHHNNDLFLDLLSEIETNLWGNLSGKRDIITFCKHILKDYSSYSKDSVTTSILQ